jgi:hypothetical protein
MLAAIPWKFLPAVVTFSAFAWLRPWSGFSSCFSANYHSVSGFIRGCCQWVCHGFPSAWSLRCLCAVFCMVSVLALCGFSSLCFISAGNRCLSTYSILSKFFLWQDPCPLQYPFPLARSTLLWRTVVSFVPSGLSIRGSVCAWLFPVPVSRWYLCSCQRCFHTHM